MASEGPERPFDLVDLFEALDAERRRRGLAWAAMSREVGVAVATIRRCAEADDMEADGVLALVRWLDVPPEHFVNTLRRTGHRLTPRGTGMVRADIDAMRAVTRTRPSDSLVLVSARRSND